jgi:hypothetical protein
MAYALAPTLVIELKGAQHPFPIISMVDRRMGKARRKTWAFVRATEQLLYNLGTSDRSTGAFKTHLDACSMEGLVADMSAVDDRTINEAELELGAAKE